MQNRFQGVGFAPEGVEQNEFVYVTALGFAWEGKFELETWLESRYR
jgi:hypothetical protein